MNLKKTMGAAIAVAGLGLAGCVTVPPDAGFSDVQDSIGARVDKEIYWKQGGDASAEVSARIRALLADELNVDEAVQIALLNNSSLQATYEDLGIAQASLVQAGLLRNPLFHAQFRYPRNEGGTNFDIEIIQSFMSIFTMPLRKRVAEHQFELAKLKVTGAVMDLALDVRKAYVGVQAAVQTEEMMAQVSETTAASVYAAERLHQAGNITDLSLANQHAIHQDARLLLASAQAEAYTARERLNVLMGLWGKGTEWTIAGRLSDPPSEEL
ncbi:MAG: TolC family protein, partial [Gammaproteobacteria bacterium]|nr:TolC family protein [Gammaproteobacteria bacterium]